MSVSLTEVDSILRTSGAAPGGLAEAVTRGEPARVLVRNYRPDGTQFWNEVVIQPMRGGDGNVTHVVGFHRDVGERAPRADARHHQSPPLSFLPDVRRSGARLLH